jgi:uncharacterized protein
MRRVVVFARAPEAGRTKTRLSPALPPVLAVTLAIAMLEDTCRAVRASGAEERIVLWDGPQGAAVPPAPPVFVSGPQQGKDLGARLWQALSEDRHAPTVVVGSDCPELTAADLDAAFGALDAVDLVLGPARDGGYYLVGLAAGRRAAALFEGIPWSSGTVLTDTLARAGALGLAHRLLEPHDDIDRPMDLVQLIARLALEPGRAPHTARALRAMNLLP